MNDGQVFSFVISVVSLMTTALAVQFKWLRPGKVMTVIVFITGLLVIVPLCMAGIPPKWFAGSAVGFGLAVTFLVTAWVPGGEEVRSFKAPLFLAMGLSMLVCNLLPHLRRFYEYLTNQ